jgi:hypothetical protein
MASGEQGWVSEQVGGIIGESLLMGFWIHLQVVETRGACEAIL